jgi:hypothetical protein
MAGILKRILLYLSCILSPTKILKISVKVNPGHGRKTYVLTPIFVFFFHDFMPQGTSPEKNVGGPS